MTIHLSFTQARVLIGLMAGLTQNEIAKQMGLTRSGVSYILVVLREIFNVPTTERLILMAQKSKSVVDYMPNQVDVLWPGKTTPIKL